MSHAATAKTLALVAGVLNLIFYGLPLLSVLPFLWAMLSYYFVFPSYAFSFLVTFFTDIVGTVVGFMALVLRPIVLRTPLGAGVPWIVFGAMGILTLGGMFLLSAGIVGCVAARTAPPGRRRLPPRPLYPPQPQLQPIAGSQPSPAARPAWLRELPMESPQSVERESVAPKGEDRVRKRGRTAKCANCGALVEPGDRYCMVCGSEVT